MTANSDPTPIAWPVFIAEGWDLHAFMNDADLNFELEPWYGDLEGLQVWDASGNACRVRRIGDPSIDQDGRIDVFAAPDLNATQQAVSDYFVEWLHMIERDDLASLSPEGIRGAVLALSLPKPRRPKRRRFWQRGQ
jgi:hypothetical protein